MTEGSLSFVSLSLLAALAAGCGGDDTSGVGGAGGGGGSGGAAGSGGSSGGTAGAPPVGDVFNPAVAVPSYDCRNDAATKACVSVSGTLAGQSIDRHCAGTTPPGALFRNPDAFPAACQESGSPLMGFWYQVTVPVQDPGVFSYDLAPGTPFVGANVTVAVDGQGGEVRSDHFTAGKLAGSVVRDGVEDELISGTFRATWGTPGVSCQAGGPDECAAGDVNGTFRVLNVLDTN